MKLRDSQIYENCQLLYNLNYFNFFQGFVHIFEIHIIRKLFPKDMNPVTSTEWEKNIVTHAFVFFEIEGTSITSVSRVSSNLSLWKSVATYIYRCMYIYIYISVILLYYISITLCISRIGVACTRFKYPTTHKHCE